MCRRVSAVTTTTTTTTHRDTHVCAVLRHVCVVFSTRPRGVPWHTQDPRPVPRASSERLEEGLINFVSVVVLTQEASCSLLCGECHV